MGRLEGMTLSLGCGGFVKVGWDTLANHLSGPAHGDAVSIHFRKGAVFAHAAPGFCDNPRRAMPLDPGATHDDTHVAPAGARQGYCGKSPSQLGLDPGATHDDTPGAPLTPRATVLLNRIA